MHVPALIQGLVQKPLKKSVLFSMLPLLNDLRMKQTASSSSSGRAEGAASSSSARADVKLNVLIAEVSVRGDETVYY